MTITSNIESIDAEQANRMLDRNIHNRPINQGDVLKWATEMEAGNWQLNGEAIKIAEDGTVLDGQHRLHAVSLQSPGVGIQFLVVRGLPAAVQRTMDQGRKRSAADQLNLDGIAASGKLSSSIRFYMIFSEGLMFRDRKVQEAEVTTPAMVRWAHEHPDEVELLRRGVGYSKIPARNAVVCTALVMFTEEHGLEVAEQFLGRLEDGVGLQNGSPILALRERLLSIRGERNRPDRATRVSDRDMLGIFVMTFNNWILEKSITKVQRPYGGTWNEQTFPTVTRASHVKISRTRRAQLAQRATN